MCIRDSWKQNKLEYDWATCLHYFWTLLRSNSSALAPHELWLLLPAVMAANRFPSSEPSCISSSWHSLFVDSKGPGMFSIEPFPLCRVNLGLSWTRSPIGYCLSRDGMILHMSCRKNWGRTICIMILFHQYSGSAAWWLDLGKSTCWAHDRLPVQTDSESCIE